MGSFPETSIDPSTRADSTWRSFLVPFVVVLLFSHAYSKTNPFRWDTEENVNMHSFFVMQQAVVKRLQMGSKIIIRSVFYTGQTPQIQKTLKAKHIFSLDIHFIFKLISLTQPLFPLFHICSFSVSKINLN